MRRLLLSGALLFLGCRGVEIGPVWHFERMVVQPRANAYRGSTVFPDGRVMQQPPAQSIARDETPGFSLVATGGTIENPARTIPIRLDRSTLETGQRKFDIICAACHGLLGNSVSPVAARMNLRRPRSLHEADIRAAEPGRIFQVIRAGYGLMPSYAALLSVEETWAIVAYVRALQLSQYAPLDSLPPALRAQALQHLGAQPARLRP